MHIDYNDITDLTNLKPDWYDQNGVPRYAPFKPEMLGVYNKYALYVEIQCQSCGRHFNVGDGWSAYDYTMFGKNWDDFNFQTLANDYHYGDPPAHGCCGDTMNCIDLRIYEAWGKDGWEWQRNPDIEETDIMQEWAK